MKDKMASVNLDLTPSLDEIKSNLHHDSRWGIGRALKEGLTINEANQQDLNEFYEIYYKYISSLDIGIGHSLSDIMANAVVLFVCKKQGKIIAGAALELTNDRGYTQETLPTLYINASLPEYLYTQPNNLLYWECIKWAKAKGYPSIDWGGYQINPRDNLIGVNKFKEKFGKVIYFERDFPFFKAIGRKLIRRFKCLWGLNKKIRKLKKRIWPGNL